MTIENPFDSIKGAILFGSKDWSVNRREAWLYGILIGWGSEACYNELALEHGWDETEVARLKRLRAEYKKISGLHQRRYDETNQK